MNVKSADSIALAAARFEQYTPESRSEEGDDNNQPRLQVVSDRVVISHRARAALAEMRRIPEVDLSIKALMNAAPLTERRAVEVLRRIRQGFYQQPEVLRKMASVLTDALESSERHHP